MSSITTIKIDSSSIEHLNIKSGLLSYIVGSILKIYGEQATSSKFAAEQPFFLAVYLLEEFTWYCSKLVDPEQIINDEVDDDDISYTNEESLVSDQQYVISALITNELVTEPNFTGYTTHVVLDSHYEGSLMLSN